KHKSTYEIQVRLELRRLLFRSTSARASTPMSANVGSLQILRRNPTFALVAVLALALGTGANAAIFQLVSALRVRPLPVERPHELVSIGIDQHGRGRVGRGYPGRSIFTEPLWQEIRTQQQAF